MEQKKEKAQENMEEISDVDFLKLQARIERKLLGDIRVAEDNKRSQYITDYHHFVSACQISMLTEKQRGVTIPQSRGGTGLIHPVM